MTKDEMKLIQSEMKSLGFYTGLIDGIWGPMSKTGFVKLEQHYKQLKDTKVPTSCVEPVTKKHIFGTKVGKDFIAKVQWIAKELNLPDWEIEGANWILACMAFETGETFSPSIKNGAGSGGTGLIQFMPATAKGMGTTTTALAKMSQIEQLDWVYKYFSPYKNRLKNLGDCYMAILWPAGIGKDDTWSLWSEKDRPTTYRQNSGLDINKDKVITRGEALKKIKDKYEVGKKYMG